MKQDRLESERPGRNLRPGRASVTVLLVVAALVAGAAGGYFLPKNLATATLSTHGTAGAPSSQEGNGENQQWYTCGMHPNVLQKGPGICPICQMNLTPRKDDDADSDAVDGGVEERKILYWRAPMDPNFISDLPGKSPMGMDLVPVYAEAAESGSAHTIRIDPITVQNMGIRTTVVERGPLVKTIRTVGRVDYDEQLVTFIDTKFNGWIEALYVDETGQYVEKGDRLFDVYSPELYAAQEEFLAAVRNLPLMEGSNFLFAREEATKLVQAARTKLMYMDVSDGQIEALRRTGEVEKAIAIHSPARGIVTDKMVLQGMYVKPGMRLYTIADLSRVWVYVDVYEYQLPWISAGQTASMTLPYVPGRTFIGKVVYIYPYVERQTRVIKVRLEFENLDMALKPGMFTNIRLESTLQGDALLIPREAYIDSGTRQVAFVDLGNGKFAPRDIQVGVEAENGMTQVLYGLDEGEVVVTSGQFMLDGESKLKEAVAKMMEAERAKVSKRSPTSGHEMEHAHDPESAEPPGDDAIPSDARYACPMDKHPDEDDPALQGAYFSPEPGRCPSCGMEFKPLDDLEWVRLRRAAQGGDVAYTCPDHPHVFSDDPGECPRCGRYLMPFKAMYACPDPEHAEVISAVKGTCPHCGSDMVAFRGVWLDESLAAANIPADPGLAEAAAYKCPIHPLVHSDREGRCTVCASPLEPEKSVAGEGEQEHIPADAKYTCPMSECWHFSAEPGECPVCGMNLKPIDEVQWVREMRATATDRAAPVTPRPAAGHEYICPMHPEEVRAAQPGTCTICGMLLVAESSFKRPQDAPQHVAAQMDYILEHYLEVRRFLASDRTTDLALHALGLAWASRELRRHLDDPGVHLPPEFAAAAERLHASSLRITGKLDADRITFVELSAAMIRLVEHVRPDRDRWPKLYIYHCPMTKGDWLQSTDDKTNPYYGFKMLKCGELRGTR